MRTKQALKNTITSLVLQLVSIVPGIVIPRLFIEAYGSPVNGLVTSIGQFITYMGLVEAGIGAAGMVALYRPLADRDGEGVNGILSAARVFYRRSGLLFLGLLALLVAFYPFAVQSEITDTGFIRTMIVVLALNGLVDYFLLGKYRVLLLADQRGYVISLAQIVGTVAMLAVSVLLIKLGCSALLVKFSTAVIYMLRAAAVAVYARRHYAGLNFHAKPRMQALGQRWDALLHQVVGMVVNSTDVVLLTLLLSENAMVEVSVYGVYNMVGYALTSVMNAFSNGLSAGFGQVISKNETEVLKKSFSGYEYLFFLAVFAVYACMAVLLHPFIAVYASTFADGGVYVRWSLVWLFAAAGLLQALRLPALTVIVAAGHYKQTRWRAVWEAVINLGLSVILIWPLGIRGVLLGTCASYLYRSTDVILYTAKRFLPGSLGLTVRRLVRNGLTAGALTALGIWLVPQGAVGWLTWALSGVGFAVVTGGVLAGVNLLAEPKEFRALLGRLKEVLHARAA